MEPIKPIFELNLTLDLSYLFTEFGANRIEIATCKVITYIHTHTHTYIHTYRKSFHLRNRCRNISPIPPGLFVKKLQSKVDLAGYDILFAYFVVEAKSFFTLRETLCPKSYAPILCFIYFH